MKTKTIILIILIIIFGILGAYKLISQTVKDDLTTLLAAEGLEQVEIIEMLKARIDAEFLTYCLEKRTNPKRLVLEYIADYTDASILYDGNGWDRLIPQGYTLYECDVYGVTQKLSFYLPADDDKACYDQAEKVFKNVHPEEVIKVHILPVNNKNIKP